MYRLSQYGLLLISSLAIILISASCIAAINHHVIPRKNGVSRNIEVPVMPAASNFSDSPIRIMLFIGDGMGSQHRKAAAWFKYGLEGQLLMDQLPFQDWLQTASANNAITDSAAAATAMAAGYQTNNGMIGVDPAGTALNTILEYAQAKGMAVGLVTTVQISHATPAAFAAHVLDRNQMTDIAMQLIDHGVNVLLGGGEDQFLPTGTAGCFPQDGERSDGRNLITEALAAGYTYVCSSAEFDTVDPAATDYLLGLFADDGMLRPFQPDLTRMTGKAIQILSRDPDGFFLMVEGGQIDWASHDNDAINAIQDTIDFDQAVNVGASYADGNPETLLIVSADHETGGMDAHLNPTGLPGEDGPFMSLEGTPFYVSWSTIGHTSGDVPISARGPAAVLVNVTHQNTSVFWLMSRLIFEPLFLPLIQE